MSMVHNCDIVIYNKKYIYLILSTVFGSQIPKSLELPEG